MTIVDFSPAAALIGGALIGLAAAGLWWLLGRIAGVSTILGAALVSKGGEVGWRLAFTAGLLLAGLVGMALVPEAIRFDLRAGHAQLTLAGLLVGVGTQMSSGCTSGHGVCGVSRLSPRSIVATATFIGAGTVSAYVWMHLL
jgi:uncharacterized membrane protein YedE/YeeE